jgi:hypothetical protein
MTAYCYHFLGHGHVQASTSTGFVSPRGHRARISTSSSAPIGRGLHALRASTRLDRPPLRGEHVAHGLQAALRIARRDDDLDVGVLQRASLCLADLFVGRHRHACSPCTSWYCWVLADASLQGQFGVDRGHLLGFQRLASGFTFGTRYPRALFRATFSWPSAMFDSLIFSPSDVRLEHFGFGGGACVTCTALLAFAFVTDTFLSRAAVTSATSLSRLARRSWPRCG